MDSAVGSFWKSLGDRKGNVSVLLMTELGRTANENGDRGTDYGHGAVFMVLNGKVGPQKINHRFESLAKDKLNEQRDIPVHFDYRLVMNEILSKHLKLSYDSNIIFPGAQINRELGLGIFRKA